MGSEPKRITEMWAWIVTEADGGEGIPAAPNVTGLLMPLVGADEARIRSLEPHARAIAGVAGMPLKLVRFFGAEVVENYP